MLTCLGVLSYHVFLERQVNAKNIINKVVLMKIDSATYYETKRSTYYEYYVGSTYHITVAHHKAVPFEQKERSNIYIQNVKGEYVFDSDFDHAWVQDIDKLFAYIKTC